MQDREKLIDVFMHLGDHISYKEEYGVLFDTPFAEAVEDVLQMLKNGVTVRERGRWIPHYETFDEDAAVGILGGTYQTGWQCSVCGRYEPSKEPYCNCGAKMDGERRTE